MPSCIYKPYPGYIISVGTSGSIVSDIQYYLNVIHVDNPTVGPVSIDGVFGSGTKKAVEAFQTICGEAVDGKVGANTWLQLMNWMCTKAPKPASKPYPETLITLGTTGNAVRDLQLYLSFISRQYEMVQPQVIDGVYGSSGEYTVRIFQSLFNLTVDGKVGRLTWNKIKEVYDELDSMN